MIWFIDLDLIWEKMCAIHQYLVSIYTGFIGIDDSAEKTLHALRLSR